MISFVKLMLPLTRFMSLTSLLNFFGTPVLSDEPPFESVLDYDTL